MTRRKEAPAARVALQRRDLQIMETLVVARAETLSELHARHFAGLSRKRAVNRLAQLARAGYLAPADVVLHGETTATRTYTLGPKARAALERRSLSSEHFRFRRFNPTLRDSSIPHQIAVNDLGRMIGAPLLPEHLLPVTDKNGAKHRPDAVIEGVDIDGRRKLLGIEVDLGHYSRERILGKYEAWKKLPDSGDLVFVVPDEARASRVYRWLPKTYVSEQFARVLTFEELREELIRAFEREDEATFCGLDIWTDGNAHEPERARREAKRREAAERELREEQERVREHELEQARRAAEDAARRQAAARKPRRRFGV